MAIQFERVKPGDLITADLMTQIMEAVEDLDNRVTALQSSGVGYGAPVITELIPSDQIRIGQELTIKGSNFMPENRAPIVSVGGASIVRFKQVPQDTILVFNILSHIPGVPNDFPVIVDNRHGADSKMITILPVLEIPTGQLAITEQLAGIGEILIGQTYDYWFDLISKTTIGETYRLTPVFDNIVGAATKDDWEANSQLVNHEGAVMSSNLLPLGAFQPPVRVGIRITIPDGAESANLVLHAQSLNNDLGLSKSSGSIPVVVGETQPVSDPRVGFELQDFIGPYGNIAKPPEVEVDTIEVPYEGYARVKVLATLDVSGEYNYSAAIESAPADTWELTNPSPNQSSEGAGDTELFGVNAILQASAPAAGSDHPEQGFLVITVTRSEGAPPDPIGSFESFKRFPIRGYVP
jgi:hypothetical protein